MHIKHVFLLSAALGAGFLFFVLYANSPSAAYCSFFDWIFRRCEQQFPTANNNYDFTGQYGEPAIDLSLSFNG